MTTAILGALKYLPASLGIKALEKISPKFKNYFAQVAAYGLDANRALEYVADQFSREGGISQEATRPDQAAARTDIRNAATPGKAIRTGLAFAGAGALTPRERPQIEAQPQAEEAKLPSRKTARLPIEDVENITPAQQPSSPQQPPGLSKKEVIGQFLENFPEEEKPMGKTKPGQAERIGRDFPQLLQFIQKKVAEGTPLPKAADLAHKSKLHGPIARKVENDTGMSVAEWAQQQLGGGQAKQGQSAVRGEVMDLIGRATPILDQLLKGRNG